MAKYSVTMNLAYPPIEVEADEYSISSPDGAPHLPPRVEFKSQGKTVANFFGVHAVRLDSE